MLSFLVFIVPPPSPLPPPPLPFQIPPPTDSAYLSPPPPSTSSYNLALIIILAILAALCLACAAIHLLLRLLSRPPSPSSSPPLILLRSPSAASTPQSSSVAFPLRLPTSSSAHCAVCLSRFRAGDVLRLLPACRHAFHSLCIDAWLGSPAASCPLCRSPVHFPSPPPPQPPRPPPPDVTQADRESVATASQRGWLKEYVDQLASPASSAFSSRRFSGRWERDVEVVDEGGGWSGAASSHR